MREAAIGLRQRSAFQSVNSSRSLGSGVEVTGRHGLSIATVQARRGQQQRLREAVRESLGVVLPQTALRASSGSVAFVGVGPGEWLALDQDGDHSFVASLSQELSALASVCDQGAAFGLLGVQGARACDVLAKVLPIDLHPDSFRIGDAARIAAFRHIGVIVWRLEDTADRAVRYEILVPRSMARYFWNLLEQR